MRKDCETHLSNFLKRPVMSMQSVSLYQYTLHRINVYERKNIVFKILSTTLCYEDQGAYTVLANLDKPLVNNPYVN